MDTDTLPDKLTVIAQSIESITPPGAEPAFVEIVGGLDPPETIRWHFELPALLGFVAPLDCQAVVFVGEGTMRPLVEGEPDAIGLLRAGERRRAKTVYLLTRAGDAAGYCREGPTIIIDSPPTVGRIPDSIRRSLGLPTPPPEEPTDGLLARMWLHEVLAAAEQADQPLGWPAVARLHPAMQVCTEGCLVIPDHKLVSCLRVAARAWSWEALVEQSASASPGWLSQLLPPGTGGWMDEGMLSRWLLGTFSPLGALLERIRPCVAPAAGRRLRTVLQQLGVLNGRHPPGG